MSRKLIDILLLTTISIFVLSLNACLEQDFDHYALSVEVKGLSTSESITVSNGSSLRISGTSDLSWTAKRNFSRDYREDSTSYSVSISRQPTNSNKICRILNPKGNVNNIVNLVRIECGYSIVIADSEAIIDNPPSMTTSNGLLISNGFETLALNSSRSLVTSLDHLVVDDLENPGSQLLQVDALETDGAVKFSKLYLDGDALNISHSSISQGCEITGATNPDSSLTHTIPDASTFDQDTVQARDLSSDWISSSSSFAGGRTCLSFPAGSSTDLNYSSAENALDDPSYNAECFGNPSIQITCGLALRIAVVGLDTGESVDITGLRNSSKSHTFTIDSNRTTTFNLAFSTTVTDTYEITSDDTNAPAKTCVFDSTLGDSVPAVVPGAGEPITANKTEVLRCS